MIRYLIAGSAAFVFIAIGAALLIIISNSGLRIKAQSQCCNPPTLSPAAGKFPQNSDVVVTISSAFTDEERNDIIIAFSDWNGANESNGSGIHYTQFLTRDTPVQSGNNQFVGFDPDLTLAGQNHLSGVGNSFYATILRRSRPLMAVR